MKLRWLLYKSVELPYTSPLELFAIRAKASFFEVGGLADGCDGVLEEVFTPLFNSSLSCASPLSCSIGCLIQRILLWLGDLVGISTK